MAAVSGKRRGKGSSREQSPYAEMMAGIRLVIAENIERIYRENCQNLGVFTSTDFSLIERIRRGEAIPLADFTRGEGEITRGIIEHGGLFQYNVARLQGKVAVPVPGHSEAADDAGREDHRAALGGRPGDGPGRRSRSVRPGDEGFVRTDIRFSHEYVTPMAAIFWRDYVGANEKVADPGSIFFFRDHLTFLELAMTDERKAEGLLDVALELKKKQEEFAAEQGIRLYGELPRLARNSAVQGSEAICHSKMLEQHALPGHVIIGSDSHTPHSGAIGCVAFGVGTTAIFNSWLTRDVRLQVPPSVLVRVNGEKPANITAKDFMLQILRQPYVRNGQAIGKIVEYAGRGGGGTLDRRAGHDDQHGGRGRRLHRHHQARRGGGRLPGPGARDGARGGRAAARGAVLRSGGGVRGGHRHRRRAAWSRWWRCRAIPATGCSSRSWAGRSRWTSPTPGAAPPGRRKTWTCTPGCCARRRRRGSGCTRT